MLGGAWFGYAGSATEAVPPAPTLGYGTCEGQGLEFREVATVADGQFEIWDLWYPEAGSTGMPFARGRLDATEVLWVHAAPPVLAVTVYEGGERVAARGEKLERVGDQFPMTRLAKVGTRVTREDRWPTRADIGAPVLLPGGEVGILKEWWNAEDGSEWRWHVEYYNHA
jgi:hypothetical protein